MYRVSVRDAEKEVVIERTMHDQPTQKDLDALLNEVSGDAYFIDVCRVDPDLSGMGDSLGFEQALDFECVPLEMAVEEFDE